MLGRLVASPNIDSVALCCCVYWVLQRLTGALFAWGLCVLRPRHASNMGELSAHSQGRVPGSVVMTPRPLNQKNYRQFYVNIKNLAKEIFIWSGLYEHIFFIVKSHSKCTKYSSVYLELWIMSIMRTWGILGTIGEWEGGHRPCWLTWGHLGSFKVSTHQGRLWKLRFVCYRNGWHNLCWCGSTGPSSYRGHQCSSLPEERWTCRHLHQG